MRDPKPTKALFRCLFAYSNGKPVEIFDVDGNYAIPNCGLALKVAVTGDASENFEDLEDFQWTERLAAAYDLFVVDPGMGEKRLRWVKPEVMRKSNRY